MTPEQLSHLLDELGQRLGPAGEHVFDLAVRQVYVTGILGVIACVAGIVIPLVTVRPMWRWIEGGGSYSDRELVGIFYVIGAIAAVGMALAAGYAAIPNLLNPEYAALRDILSAVTP